MCILSKKRGEGKRKWILNNKPVKRVSFSNEEEDQNEDELNKPIMDKTSTDKTTGRKWQVGQCLSCDDVGPISPASLEGYKSFFIFKDICSRRIHIYLVDECDENSYLEALDETRKFYFSKGHKIMTIRTDYKTTFRSALVKAYGLEHNITSEASTPYHQWQNAVEREVQTMLCNVSANVYGQLLLRADTWAAALQYYAEVHNSLPNLSTKVSPNKMIDSTYVTDATYQYKYSFGDIICYGIPKKIRTWKFSVRNDIGFYMGDMDGMKGTYKLYNPYEHNIMPKGDTAKINISEVQLLSWYGRRVQMHESTMPYMRVQEALIDLLGEDLTSEEGYVESVEQPAVQPLKAEVKIPEVIKKPKRKSLVTTSDRELRPYHTPEYAPRYQLLQRESDPKDTKPILCKHDRDNNNWKAYLLLEDNRQTDYDNAMRQFYMKEIHVLDELSEEIDTKEALKASDKEKFIEAIKKEVESLIYKTNTLSPISEKELKRRCFKIGITMKCKRKKRGSGQLDKYKARGAARGDQLAAQYKLLGIQPPETYSPTITALTFALMMQIAVNKKLIMKTADITAAYLQVVYPEDKDPLLVKFEAHIAVVCNMDPNQLYRVNKYIYGLPDSGRAFYIKYSTILITEGYKKSSIDPCLFYKKSETEETYVAIHVDDTYIFSNKQEHIDILISSINKHLEITLDTNSDSFLGIQFNKLPDGGVKLTQPKLLNKIFKEYPPRQQSRRHIINHPYGSTNNIKSDIPADYKKYMRLQGMLMYLCKSRPDILAAVSFTATHSQNPTEQHYESLLSIVDYVKNTESWGHTIQYNKSDEIQLYCEVDASYLIHEDSKSHTGYTISLSPIGTFYNRSSKQALVSTSSTHAEMRAVYTLVKDILYIIALCKDIQLDIKLPAIIMEDNSAVLTISKQQCSYLKRCKHFLMIINYVREQVQKGLITMSKISGMDNNADIHTKQVRSTAFKRKAQHILGEEVSENQKEKLARVSPMQE